MIKPTARYMNRQTRAVAEQLESRAYLSAVSFAQPMILPLPGQAAAGDSFTSPVAADFNGDGHPDFAVIDTSNDTLDVMLNNGDGTFSLSQALPTGHQPGSLQAVALNNGDTDLLFVNSLDATVEFYLGNGDGTFSTTPTVISFGSPASSGPVTPDNVYAADVTGNGLPDILVGVPGGIITLLNGGNDQFSQILEVGGGLGAIGRFVGSDSTTDVVNALTSGSMQIFTNTGSGLAFTSSVPAVPASLTDSSNYVSDGQVVVGDFNGDGNADLATVISDSQTETSYVSVSLGNGDGTFQAAVLTAIPYGATQLAVGSFTSSGRQDLLAQYPGYTDIFTCNGDGTFTDAKLEIPETNWSNVAVADYNNDGQFDALFGNSLVLNTTGLRDSDITLSAKSNAIAPGQQLAVTATVTGKGGAATGTVLFIDDTTATHPKALAVGTLDNGATTVSLALGSEIADHDVVAEYLGDTTFAAGVSPALLEAVEKNAGVPIGPTVLTPTVVKTTLMASTPADTRLTNAFVTITLTNSTGIDAKGPLKINLYAAPASVLNTSLDTLLTQVSKSETLKVGKSATLTIPIKSLPASRIGANDYLIVQTVDSAGSASGASAQTFGIAAPFISLSERVASLNLPPTITDGEKLRSTLKLLVTNNGNITDDGVSIEVSASQDPTIAGTSFLHIKTLTKIAPGKAVTVTIPIKVLPALAAGGYFLLAQTIDASMAATLASSTSEFTIAP